MAIRLKPEPRKSPFSLGLSDLTGANRGMRDLKKSVKERMDERVRRVKRSQRFTFEDLQPAETIDLKSVRPFMAGELFQNDDGSVSTEKLISVNIGGDEVVAPSLWMTANGPVDLSRRPQIIMRAILSFEQRSGKAFPRFESPEQATAFAKSRSNSGGVTRGPLER